MVEFYTLVFLGLCFGGISTYISIRFFILYALASKMHYFARLEREGRLVIPWTTHTALFAIVAIMIGLLVGSVAA